MTVKDLFYNFSEYFDTIIYFDVSGNTNDYVTIVDGDRVYPKVYDDFLRRYGEYTVTDWFYRYNGNVISVQIEKDDDDEDMVGGDERWMYTKWTDRNDAEGGKEK